MNFSSSSARRSVWLSACALLLCACNGNYHTAPDAEKVRQFAQHGYPLESQYGYQTSSFTWQLAGSEISGTFLLPSKSGQYPLVIYLPGVGEGPNGGLRWRTAWARAGYAVLCIQLLPSDLREVPAPRAPEKRDRDSGAPPPDIAVDYLPELRAHYSNDAMVARLTRLAALLDELQRRQSSGDPALAPLDLGHIALAGFDLGAYSAMVAVGEHVAVAEDLIAQRPIAAVIAISPYASFSGASFARRYNGIHAPVLSITSDADADSHGLVTEGVRGAPYQYMPPGNKYLLTLFGLSHQALAGRAVGQADDEPSPDRPKSSRTAGSADSARSGRGGPDDGGPAGTVMQSATLREQELVAIESVSTAFLDATVKSDSIAREWLQKNAPGWLTDEANLQWR